MAAHNFNVALASAPSRYTKAKRGGNKELVNSFERNNYDNNLLLKYEYMSNGIHKTTLKKHSIMENSIKTAVDSYLCDSRIERVLALRALRAYLVSEDGKECANVLFRSFCSFSHSLALVPLTKAEIEDGAVVVNEYSLTDKNGKQIRRSSWGVSDRGVSGTLVSSAFSTWFSYIRAAYNLEESETDKYHKEFAVCAALLEYAKGGRTALSDSEKKEKRAKKAVSALSASDLLKALSPAQLKALLALSGGSAVHEDSKEDEKTSE